MKLSIIESEIVTIPECRHELLIELIQHTIDTQVPACADQFLYHPAIKSESWLVDDYGTDDSVSVKYTFTMTPITHGEDTTKEWEDIKTLCYKWMKSESLYFEYIK